MNNWQPGLTLDEMEKEAILSAIRFYEGNLTAAAESLGINIRTIHNKVDEYQERESLAEARREKQRRLDLEKQQALRGDFGSSASCENISVELPAPILAKDAIEHVKEQTQQRQIDMNSMPNVRAGRKSSLKQ